MRSGRSATIMTSAEFDAAVVAHLGAPRRYVVARNPTRDADLDLRRAIDRLSRRQREIVLLHYYVDSTVADVAILLGCSAGTVKSTLSDARTRPAELLEENADA